MNPKLAALLNQLADACEAQEAAFQAARKAPQEMYHTRDAHGRHIDPRFNTTAGARVTADKIVVDLARQVAAVWRNES